MTTPQECIPLPAAALVRYYRIPLLVRLRPRTAVQRRWSSAEDQYRSLGSSSSPMSPNQWSNQRRSSRTSWPVPSSLGDPMAVQLRGVGAWSVSERSSLGLAPRTVGGWGSRRKTRKKTRRKVILRELRKGWGGSLERKVHRWMEGTVVWTLHLVRLKVGCSILPSSRSRTSRCYRPGIGVGAM